MVDEQKATGSDGITRELADAMPFIVWTRNDEGVATYFNRRWTQYTGYTLDATLAAGVASFVHPEDRSEMASSVERFRSGESAPASVRIRGKDGAYRWHEVRMVPAKAEGDRVVLWVGTAIDVDDRVQASHQQDYLVRATEVLGTSLDLQKTLADVARLVVPVLADWCAIDLLTSETTVERAAVAHVDPSKVTLAWDLWKLQPPKPTDPRGFFEVVRTRKPDHVVEVTEEMLVAAVRDPALLQVIRDLGLRSSVAVPLIARGTVLGALSLVTAESGKIYGKRDVVFAEEMARRIAIAIDNARLYEEATRARVAAEAISADAIEQSKTVEAELLTMRRALEEARSELQRMRTEAEKRP